MATVSGLTKERMLVIEAKSITGGFIDSNGHLKLTARDGTQIDAGSVQGPVGPVGPPSLALNAWPIKSIFMNVSATNPSLLLGGGTWERWGQGRVPLSVWESDGRFDTPEELGGEFEHTLSWNEMPQHFHGVSDGGHTHDTLDISSQLNIGYGGGVFMRRRVGAYGENVSVSATGVSIQNAGGSAAHNNIQPYITVYMWKRTA